LACTTNISYSSATFAYNTIVSVANTLLPAIVRQPRLAQPFDDPLGPGRQGGATPHLINRYLVYRLHPHVI